METGRKSPLSIFPGVKEPLLAKETDIHLGRLIRFDREEFSKVVQVFGDRLFHWLARLTRDTHAAEDLTQETFVRAWKALGRLRPDTRLSAWLFRIAHNGYANWVRSRVGRNDPLPELTDRQAGPDLAAEGSEAQEKLQAALGRLPEDWRAALLLRVNEDMPFKEVALACGVTEETARWRVYKARKKLLELMEESNTS